MGLCLAVPWSLRALLLYEKRLGLSPVDLRGLLADASIALLVIGLVWLLLRTGTRIGRGLSLGALLLFLLGTFAIYEFISVFDSLYALSHAGYLADRTFLGGSVLHARHPIWLFVAMGAAALAVLWAVPPPAGWWRWWGVAYAVAVFGQVAFPVSYERDEWRQRHAIQANLEALPRPDAVGEGRISAEVRAAFRPDM
ncbi:MAG: hypothetical protein ACN4G0_06850, partial [Polyangiales bacterium]